MRQEDEADGPQDTGKAQEPEGFAEKAGSKKDKYQKAQEKAEHAGEKLGKAREKLDKTEAKRAAKKPPGLAKKAVRGVRTEGTGCSQTGTSRKVSLICKTNLVHLQDRFQSQMIFSSSYKARRMIIVIKRPMFMPDATSGGFLLDFCLYRYKIKPFIHHFSPLMAVVCPSETPSVLSGINRIQRWSQSKPLYLVFIAFFVSIYSVLVKRQGVTSGINIRLDTRKVALLSPAPSIQARGNRCSQA